MWIGSSSASHGRRVQGRHERQDIRRVARRAAGTGASRRRRRRIHPPARGSPRERARDDALRSRAPQSTAHPVPWATARGHLDESRSFRPARPVAARAASCGGGASRSQRSGRHARAYRALLSQFLRGDLPEERFQWGYLDRLAKEALWRDDETFALLDSLFENDRGRDVSPARLVAVEFQGQLAGRLEPLRPGRRGPLNACWVADNARRIWWHHERSGTLRANCDAATRGQSFVLATVVARRAPVSAHLGDRALVFPDGRMEGFIGGACSREIIRQQALEVLKTRCSRLVSIQPDAKEAGTSTGEHVVVPMTCVSEGAIDVYVEPFVEARRIVVVGATPVAEWLARMARAMDYDVVRVVDARNNATSRPRRSRSACRWLRSTRSKRCCARAGPPARTCRPSSYHRDTTTSRRWKPFSRAACRTSDWWRHAFAGRPCGHCSKNAGCLALRRFAFQPDSTSARGLRPKWRCRSLPKSCRRVRAACSWRPQYRRLRPRGSGRIDRGAVDIGRAVDPVCGMSVNIASSRHHAEVDGVVYHFCCAGCRAKFIKDPQAYLLAND